MKFAIMNVQTELASLQARIAKAPQTQRIVPRTRRRLFAILNEAGLKELTGDYRMDRVHLWRLITGRNVDGTNALLDMEAKIFADWLTNHPNTGQPRHEAVTAVRAWLTGTCPGRPVQGAGGEGQMELAEREGENMEQQEQTGQVELNHAEARVIAYTTFVLKGVQINFTMREGATAEIVKDLVREMGEASKWLKESGGVPVLSRDALANGNGRTTPAPQQSGPPAPVKAPSSPPPVASSGNGDGDIEAIDFVKITAPKGKPVVEFWRKGRQWAEVKWHLGGERLLEFAPTLATAGWEAAHFDDIGQEYPLKLAVSWVQSPKNEKWKDITAIELAG